MNSLARATRIFWEFGRRNLFAGLYLDLYRAKLGGRSCRCADDNRLKNRAVRLRSALEDLGPVFIKLGQILARRGDVFPPAYIKELESLQDHARPVAYAEIRFALEAVCICDHGTARFVAEHKHALLCFHCQGIDHVFERFDSDPLAVASLAQVHRARFHGDEVVVKVLKPGVLDVINRDLSIFHRFRKSLIRAVGLSHALDPDEFFEELQRSLTAEVDLQAEGLHMDAFRESAGEGINAPKVHWGFLRDDVLIMEFVQGEPLDQVATPPRGTRPDLANRLALSFLDQVFIQNLFHGDPHPGNLLLRLDEIVFIDFGAVSRLDPETQRHLRRLLLAMSKNEVSEAAAAMLDLCGKPKEELSQVPGLLVDIGLITQGFRTGAGTRWSDRIVEIARRFDLKLPRSVLSLAKSLVLVEAMALNLDPEFRLQAVLQQFMREAAPKEARRAVEDIQAALTDYGDLAREAPTMIRQLADQAAIRSEGRSGDRNSAQRDR